MVHYAIGDIHGRDDLLDAMYARIQADYRLRHEGERAVIVHLGDYIDGGSESRGVVDRVMRGVDGFESVHLLGNHEAMMLECLVTDDRQVWMNWLGNGGDETLRSFGVSFRFGGYDPKVLVDTLGPDRLAWFRSLRSFCVHEEYLFVHAGIRPGIPIESQKLKDLLWIRGRFLESDADHGYIVVHGHTPTDLPVRKHNRIGIDTGAAIRGELSAVALEPAKEPRFLSVEGSVQAHVSW